MRKSEKKNDRNQPRLEDDLLTVVALLETWKLKILRFELELEFFVARSLSNQIAFSCQSLTSSKVDEDVAKKNGVRDHVEDDPAVVEVEVKVGEQPAGGEVIVEEGDGDGEDDKVGHEE